MYVACRVLRPAVLAALTALLLPSLCSADATRLGNSFPVTAGTGTKRTDVAYDPVNDVYLVTTGGLAFPGTVSGRFVQGDGTPIGGAFKIPDTNTHSQSARVAYSADLGGFAVVWLDTRADQAKFTAQVWGRLVKYSGGGPAFASGDFYVDNATGGVNPEVPPAIACASGANECLVAWHQYGGGAEPADDVHAARFTATTGSLVGGELFLTNDNWWQGMPAVGYDAASGTYLVAYSVFTNVAQIWVQRVQAGGGAVGGPIGLAQSGGIFVPDVAVNTSTHQFMVSWYDATARTFFGRYVAPNGSTGTTVPLLAGYGGYDAFGIAYNPTNGTFIAVTHGLAFDDVAFQILGNGTPQAPFDATAGTGTKNGNFNPRVAASPQRAEWMMSTSTDFVTVFGSRIGSSDRSGTEVPPPPPPSGPQPTGIDLAPANAPNGSWFLAEGSANSSPNGFKTFYLIQNSNPVDVGLRVYYANDTGTAYAKLYTLPANSRKTLSLISEIGPGNWSTVFQSITPGADIDVERSMFWGPNLEGSTDATATKVPSQTWYFAEGSRGGELFNNYYLLFNPSNVTSVQVSGTFYRFDGQVVSRTFNIGPQQRYTVDANAIQELAGTDFAATFASTSPIVAERAMYWGWAGSDQMWIGGHATMGAQQLYPSWMFAEGNAAPNFETFFLLLNPNPTPIVVHGDFRTEFSGRLQKDYVIPGSSRYTVYVNGEFGNIGPTSAAFTTGDGSAFLAERSIYWGNRVEGTNTIGTPGAAAEWHLPEGSTMASFYTYEMLMNPNDFPVPVDVTVYVEGVGKFTLPEVYRPVIPANARLTLDMRSIMALFDQLTNGQYPVRASSFATRVAVPGGGVGIVVEHAMYWNFVNTQIYWRSGGSSMGISH